MAGRAKMHSHLNLTIEQKRVRKTKTGLKSQIMAIPTFLEVPDFILETFQD